MDQNNEVNKYQDLYSQYKDLVTKTTIKAYTVITGEKIDVQNISYKDLEERDRIADELKKGLIFLTDNQLIDLSGDIFFAKDALSTLQKRREVQ